MAKKIILWTLCIFWAIIIFSFSSEPAIESDETSLGFTERVIAFLVDINIIDIPASIVDSSDIIHNMAEKLNNTIRKLAHFTIYLILGVLVYELSLCYLSNKKAFILALLLCLLYAVSDEIHQLFVPGRAGQIRDVIIDFMGALFGTIIILIIRKIKFKKRCS